MPTSELKGRFALEGEQKFKTAMSEAANSVRVLNSQQKLAQAQFKQTGDAQKYASQQADILRQKIEAQKKAVQAAETAIKQLTSNGVSQNSRQMQAWQQKLYNAQTELTKMETELKNVTSEMGVTTQQADQMNNSLDSIGKKVNFDAVIGGIDRITDAMWSAISMAGRMGAALTEAMRDAAGWADDLATQSVVYNIDADTLQRMRYTADILDTSVETIVKSRQRLINSMVSGGDDVQGAFAKLGVQVREYVGGKFGDAEGPVRDWADVFWETGRAMIEKEETLGFEEVSNLAQKIFGRSYEQLRPLFASDWKEQGYESARAYYDAVMKEWDTVSEENVGKLTTLDDSVQKLENSFETLKMNVLSELAPGFTKLADSFSGLITQFNKYLETDEGKEKMQALSDAVSSLFDGLSDIEFGNAMDAAGAAISKLTNGLRWIRDNWGKVQAGLLGLAGALGLMKVSEGVLKLFQMMSAGKYLFGNKGGGDAAKTVGSGGGGGGILQTAWSWVQSKMPSVADASNPLNAIKDVFGATNAGALIDWATNNTRVGQETRNTGDFFGAVRTAWDEKKAEIKANVDSFAADWEGLIAEVIVNSWSEKNSASEQGGVFQKALDEFAAFFGTDDNPKNPVEVPTEPEVPKDAAKDLAEQVGIVQIPAQLVFSGAGYGGRTGGGTMSLLSDFGNGLANIFGIHANGLWSVPFDNYPALLHRGERVVPAREVNSRSYNSNLYVEKMIMNNGADAQGLANAMAAANRRRMSGYGS